MKKTKPSLKITREAILEEIAKHHLSFVGYAFSILRNWTTAEDAVQETYLAISDKWESYQPTGSVISWARRVLHNKCYDYLRARKEAAFPPNEIQDLFESSFNLFDTNVSANLNEKINILGKCFKKLKPRFQQLLYDFYVKGESCREIANLAGQQEKTPVIQLHRLRRQLRTCIQKNTSESEYKEKFSDENETLLDEFFTENTTTESFESLANLIRDEPNAHEIISAYILEWCLFAHFLKHHLDICTYVANDEIGRFSSKTHIKDVKMNVTTGHRSQQTQFKTDKKIRQKSQANYKIWYSFAASIVLSIGLWISTNLNNQDGKKLGIVASGSAETRSINGSISQVIPGSIIHYGDTLSVPKNSHCAIEYIANNTILEIEENTKIEFLNTNKDDKKLRLTTGNVLFEIDRQPTMSPMVIETPQATLTVLGTRFQLQATPSKTKIYMLAGRVIFRTSNSDNQQIISAGDLAKIEDNNIEISKIAIDDSHTNSNRTSSPIPNKNLLINYTFDNDQDKQIRDSSTFHFDGQIQSNLNPNTCRVFGKFGSGFSFPASAQNVPKSQIIVPEFSHTAITDQLSLALWIKASLKDDKIQGIEPKIINLIGSNDGIHNTGWSLVSRIRANSQLGLAIGFKVGGANLRKGRESAFIPNELEWDQWVHITANFNSGMLQLFKNGKIASKHDMKINAINIGENPVLTMGPNSNVQYNIVIDEVAIYNKAIDTQDVQRIYRN